MTQEIKISINGLENNQAKNLINSILEIFTLFTYLDLRRFGLLLVTDTFETEIKKLSLEKKLIMKNKFLENNNTHAVVLTFKKENDYESVLVLKSSFAINLIKNEKNPIRYKDAIHIVHHELAHIHDNNKKIDAKNRFNNSKEAKKDNLFLVLSQLCWSEYIANYISSASAKKSEYPLKMANKLIDLIRTRNEKVQILLKRIQKDHDENLIIEISEDINILSKTASYLLGYLHGFKITLEQLDKDLNKELEESYFKETWHSLSYNFYSIRKKYPHCFKKDNVYDGLNNTIENLYSNMGLVFSKKDKIEEVFKKVSHKV